MKGRSWVFDTPGPLAPVCWGQQLGFEGQTFGDISGCLAPRVQTGVWCPALRRDLSRWLYYSEHMMLWLQQPGTSGNSAELGMGFSPAEVSMWVVSDTRRLAQTFLEPA